MDILIDSWITVIRQVDMSRAIESFMQTAFRTVNGTFSDVQLNKRFYQVDLSSQGFSCKATLSGSRSWTETGNDWEFIIS